MTQLDRLRARVCTANRRLPAEGLTVLTWGNVSALDRESGLMVIKPSGIPYPELTPENMVIVDTAGRFVEGCCQPSTDTATHLALYERFPAIGSIVHTHSPWATVWAQLGRPIPPLGTTHADDFGAEILCSRPMTPEEIRQDYEANTGRVIAEALSATSPSWSAAMGRSYGIRRRKRRWKRPWRWSSWRWRRGAVWSPIPRSRRWTVRF